MTQTDLTIITPMTETEARVLVEEIKTDISTVGAKLLELHEREGWRALGYTSWRECVMAEFDFQQSHVYRLLEFARIERNLSPIGENGYPMPASESVVRPLVALSNPETQREVWMRAVETAPGKITAKHVEAVVELVRKPEKVRCRYYGCDNQLTVPLSTLICTKCGAQHQPGQIGYHLTPGEEQRLDELSRPHIPVEPDSFKCPRCGQRTVRVNGGAVCLNEACRTSWDRRRDFEDEVEISEERRPLTVDFHGIVPAQMAADLATLEQNGFGGSPMAAGIRAEIKRRDHNGMPFQALEYDTRTWLHTYFTESLERLPETELEHFEARLVELLQDFGIGQPPRKEPSYAKA